MRGSSMAGQRRRRRSVDTDDIGGSDDEQKLYKNQMSPQERLEVLHLFQSSTLIKGPKTIGCFVSLIYANTQTEAASLCTICQQIFSISHTVTSSIYKHHNAHADRESLVIEPPAYFKQQLSQALAEMVSIDVVPFSTVDNEGFRKLLDLIYQTSVEMGKVTAKNSDSSQPVPSIENYLPCRITVKNYVTDFVEHKLPEFDAYMLDLIVKYGGALSMDFAIKNSNYYVITCHFLNNNWDLQCWTFDFCEYTRESSRAVEVRQQFFSLLNQHGIDEALARKNLIITTDRGSNLVSALRNYTRLDDICHQLNILSKRLITPYKADYITTQINLPDDVAETLDTCNKRLKDLTLIVKAVNARPSLKNELKNLGNALVKYTEVRWLSRYLSIKSYLNLNDEQRQLIHDELYSHQNTGRYLYREALTAISENMDIFTSYVNLLEPVYHAVKLLEGEKYPTINLILEQYALIKQHFEQVINDAEEDIFHKHMAISGLEVLKYQQTIESTCSEIHLLGLLLDPLKKDNIQYWPTYVDPETSFEEIFGIFKHYVKDCNVAEAAEVDPYATAPPSPFAVYISATQPAVPDPIDNEIRRYLSLPSDALRLQYHDVLDFWRSQEGEYPKTAKLAHKILAITSSASSERVFSLLGRTLSKARSNLKPNTVSSLISMKNLLKFQSFQRQSNDE